MPLFLNGQETPLEYDQLATYLGLATFVVIDSAQSASAFTGTGASSFTEPDVLDVRTGTTTGSTARRTWSNVEPLGVGAAGSNMNWSKDFDVYFVVARSTDEANIVAYVNLKNETTHADMAAVGVGIKISNLTMALESYGSSQGTAGSFVMTAGTVYYVRIRRRSGIILWYVDGASQTAQATAANIPSGNAGVSANVSIGNGAGIANGTMQVGAYRILRKT